MISVCGAVDLNDTIRPQGKHSLAPRRVHGRRAMQDSNVKVLTAGNKRAIRLQTPSGVTALIAEGIQPELLRALARKLERKLRRSGHLPKKGCGT